MLLPSLISLSVVILTVVIHAGWSTALLFAVVQRAWSIHASAEPGR